MNEIDDIPALRMPPVATALHFHKSFRQTFLLASAGAILLAAASPAIAESTQPLSEWNVKNAVTTAVFDASASPSSIWPIINWLALGPIVNGDELESDAGRGIDPTANGTVVKAIKVAALGFDPAREQLAEMQTGANFQFPSAIHYLCRDKFYSDSGAIQNQHTYGRCDPGGKNGGVIVAMSATNPGGPSPNAPQDPNTVVIVPCGGSIATVAYASLAGSGGSVLASAVANSRGGFSDGLSQVESRLVMAWAR